VVATTNGSPAPNIYAMSYTPPTPWDSGEPYKVRIEASDLAGNAMAPYEFTFVGSVEQTPTPIPRLTPIYLAGYMTSDLRVTGPQNITAFAYVGGPVEGVELFFAGTPSGVLMQQLDPQNYQIVFANVDLSGSPTPASFILELVPFNNSIYGEFWPYLNVGP
jgi:hypothetical protein